MEENNLLKEISMLPFMQLIQFREIRPHVRYAHYTENPLSVPMRYIFDHELVWIEKGRGTIITELGSHSYHEGSILFIPPGTLHSFLDDPNCSEHAHWAIHFDWEPQANNELVRIVGDEDTMLSQENIPHAAAMFHSMWLPNLIRIDYADTAIRALFVNIVEVFRGDQLYRTIELQTGFLQLIHTLATNLQDCTLAYTSLTEKKSKNPKQRSDITNYIMKLHEAVKQIVVSDRILGQWQETIFFSAPHFHRLFKEQTGCTLHEYFTKLRIDRGIQLLLGTELSIQEIAHACGYEDSKYFSKLFRQHTGLSPMHYREHYLRQQ
jgi:AraC-like DNA-binding protein